MIVQVEARSADEVCEILDVRKGGLSGLSQAKARNSSPSLHTFFEQCQPGPIKVATLSDLRRD
ncbi:MAG TPA: hypothetical protein VGU25_16525 [Acidobacteriaceae bacterium]|nr:hypothetical protein [Acidobacteriaceae bacterium]